MSPFRTLISFVILASAIQLAGLSTPLVVPAEKNKLAQTKTEQSPAHSKIESENSEFMKRYVTLTPQVQVEIWAKASGNMKVLRSSVEWRMQTEMEQALVLEGAAATPYLSKLLVAGNTGRRLRVLKMLCDMDRFVPDEEIPLEAARDSIYVPALQKGGRLNPFIPVDGHRIGKEALNAILALANQSENRLIQFYARLWTGQIRKELENLSLEEQIRRWREAVVKTRIVARESEFPEFSSTYRLLELIWMERMPESIPALAGLLERDEDPYVREELINVFAHADGCSVRLRKLESGRQAIEAVRHALEHGSLVLGYKSKKQRSDGLDLLLANFNKDEVRIDPPSLWALYGQALESFYGDNTMVDFNPKWIRGARPELRSFVSYLTEKDPYFPRWEYTHCDGPSGDEVMHPRFWEKIERLHSEWQLFAAGRTN